MTRKRSAPFVVAAFVLLACSSNGSKSQTANGSLTFDGGSETTTSIVVGADGSSTVVVASGDTISSSPDAGGRGSDSATPTIALDGGGPPGSFAPAILGAPTSEVDLDVRAQSGAAPGSASIDHLVSVLRDVSGKTIIPTDGSPIGGSAQDWSGADLQSLADDAGSPRSGGGHAVLHLLFVHGTFGGDNSVLGIAIRGDTAAIFSDRVHASATPLVGSAGIETAVVTHEAGHLLGLVDLYLHTGRQDPAHPGHSTDRNSVMYWAVESDLVADLLQGGPPRDFDSADLADLATIRNGG